MRKRTQAREYALQMLYQYELNPEPLDKLFVHFWDQNPDPSDETRLFAQSLVKGTVDNLEKINEVVAKYAENWDMNRMAVIDRSILRFATYELLFREDIPLKVSINEAVNIAKKFSQEDSGKFVNGILDKISHSEKPRDRPPAESGVADPDD
ncbi:MAG TPA: transcription antitermination factor NusB [Verrucomicrobiae bacterium]|jgi:N utilization substance protein B|nr:transcription antitermination factor NusB [Verrucomicrobiae bacterium]